MPLIVIILLCFSYFGIIHIKFIHNHSPDCAAILRYRTPSEDVQKYFRSMFENGFSPSQAYNSYKQHLYVQCSNNYDEAIVDRGVNPDKRWVKCFENFLIILWDHLKNISLKIKRSKILNTFIRSSYYE